MDLSVLLAPLIMVLAYFFKALAYCFGMLGIFVALMLIIGGKVQFWISLAFAPIGVATYIWDRGTFLRSAIAMAFTGLGVYLIASTMSNITVDAYVDAIINFWKNNQLGDDASVSEKSFQVFTIAMLSFFYALFYIFIVINAQRWAGGLFGGVTFGGLDMPRGLVPRFGGRGKEKTQSATQSASGGGSAAGGGGGESGGGGGTPSGGGPLPAGGGGRPVHALPGSGYSEPRVVGGSLPRGGGASGRSMSGGEEIVLEKDPVTGVFRMPGK